MNTQRLAPRARRLLSRWMLGVLAATVLPCASAAVRYYPFSIDEDALAEAPDQSALNQRIEAADRLFVRDGHFYRVGADGKPGTGDDSRVRLYGVNLSLDANFPKEADAQRIARRLRKLGFNAVRLHHMDTLPDAAPGAAGSILTTGAYPSLNPVAVGRLKGFIRALRQEGLYVNLNLHVGYRFRPALDGVPALNAKGEPLPMGGPHHVFHPRLIAMQQQFAQSLLRALELRDEPALAMVEINNESSLAALWRRWQTETWDELIQGPYEQELRRQWNAWAVRKHGSLAKACSAWGGCRDEALLNLLTPRELAHGPTAASDGWMSQALSAWRRLSGKVSGWIAKTGLSTGSDTVQGRDADFIQFIADTDKAYLASLRQTIRAEAGPLVPITGTQMFFGGVLNFDSHSDMDYIDEHFYVDHYDFPHQAWDRDDWRIHNRSLAGSELPRLLALGFHRDLAKPYVISEYNQPWPNQQGAEMVALMAAVASAQDWDGLFFFDYAEGQTWGNTPSSFKLSGDWGKVALMGQAARMFRQSLIAPLTARLALPLDKKTLLALAATRDHQVVETFAQRLGLNPTAAIGQRLGVSLGAAAAPLNLAPPAPGPLQSPNREFSYDANAGVVTLNATQVRGIFGYVGHMKRVDAGDLSIELGQTSRGYANVLLTSLEAAPIADASRLLLSLPGSVVGSQPGAFPQRPKSFIAYDRQPDWWTLEPDITSGSGKPSGPRDAVGPVWMEQVECRITLRTAAAKLAVYPLDGTGRKLAALPESAVKRTPQGFEIQLQSGAQVKSPWYVIELDKRSNVVALNP